MPVRYYDAASISRGRDRFVGVMEGSFFYRRKRGSKIENKK